MNFTFIIPSKIIFGWHSLNIVRDELKELKKSTPLIVTSKGMTRRENFLKFISLIKNEERLPFVFNEVEPEPSIELVEKCVNISKGNCCDLVIGFGGGSVLDVAKKVAMDLNLPKFMIPTTAGTGSEVTHESVLKVKGKKKAFVDEKLTPDIAIVDPNLMLTMPKRLVASSGIDCLAHAVEAYQCKKKNILTATLAYNAYLLVRNNLRKAVLYDKDAIANMALASLMAGMAFGNSGTTLSHALSYPLSNKGIPHGESVAIVLPYALEFNELDKEVISEIKSIIAAVGLLTKFKASISEIHEMASTIMEDEKHLSNNPKKVTVEDVILILRKISEV